MPAAAHRWPAEADGVLWPASASAAQRYVGNVPFFLHGLASGINELLSPGSGHRRSAILTVLVGAEGLAPGAASGIEMACPGRPEIEQ